MTNVATNHMPNNPPKKLSWFLLFCASHGTYIIRPKSIQHTALQYRKESREEHHRKKRGKTNYKKIPLQEKTMQDKTTQSTPARVSPDLEGDEEVSEVQFEGVEVGLRG